LGAVDGAGVGESGGRVCRAGLCGGFAAKESEAKDAGRGEEVHGFFVLMDYDAWRSIV